MSHVKSSSPASRVVVAVLKGAVVEASESVSLPAPLVVTVKPVGKFENSTQ